MMNNLYSRPKSSESGFTLMELSIVVLILGTIIAVVATGYQAYQSKKLIEVTQERVTQATAKLEEYRKIHGFYPCPAPIDVTRGAPDYGMPLASCLSRTTGTCAAGVCTQTSQRPGIGNVEAGAIPFRELNIPEAEAYDTYGSHLIYAVTAGMTTAATLKENAGGISIKNELDEELTSPPASAQFLVLSPGTNRLGGYNMNGQRITLCEGDGADKDNCDFQTGVVEAVFRSNTYSRSTDATGATAGYFDDVVAFNAPEERALWRKGIEQQGEHNDDMIDMAQNAVVMGMPENLNLANAQLSILFNNGNSSYDGSLYVRPDPADPTNTGKLKAKKVCDITDRCFEVNDLERDCRNAADGGGPGQYVMGIFSGRVQCGKVYFGCKKADGTPDTSKYISGIRTDIPGAPICSDVPPEPVNGKCGLSNGVVLSSAPAGMPAACNPGYVINANEQPAQGDDPARWTWDCEGIDGGTTDTSCSAEGPTPPYNGKCGTDNGATLQNTPQNFCLVNGGTMDNLQGTGPWTWDCIGAGPGHTNDLGCRAEKEIIINIVCEPGP